MDESHDKTSRETALVLRDRRDALVRVARSAVRDHVPLPVRIERKRAVRYPAFLLERKSVARELTEASDRRAFRHALATRASPMKRGSGYDAVVQRGKEINVRRVVRALNGLRIEPGQLFSYHHVVGRPSVLRGFAPGPELREGRLALGVGGGACQVTNMLLQLGLLGGFEVVERHRHGLDLFPDTGRDVPFGCGATVFYNMADLRLRNPHPFPAVWRLLIRDGVLLGALVAPEPLADPISVFETVHRFVERDDGWWRENRVVREAGGRREEVLHNVARTAYTPAEVSAPRQHLRSAGLRWDARSDDLGFAPR